MVRELFFLHSFLRATCVFGVRSEELRQCQAATAEQTERYEAMHLGGFKRIYPREGGEKYDKYFKHSSSLFQETAASKAREECARYALVHALDTVQERPNVLTAVSLCGPHKDRGM